MPELDRLDGKAITYLIERYSCEEHRHHDVYLHYIGGDGWIVKITNRPSPDTWLGRAKDHTEYFDEEGEDWRDLYADGVFNDTKEGALELYDAWLTAGRPLWYGKHRYSDYGIPPLLPPKG